jgi:excisionase family DNA binding protein
MTTQLITPAEAAKLLKITRRTVYAWLRSNILPAFKFGRCWRIRIQDIEQPDRHPTRPGRRRK